jgi:hypothetical protein
MTFVIEFTVKLNGGVNPDDVTFDIDLVRMTPKDANNEPCGHVTGYTTTENYEE